MNTNTIVFLQRRKSQNTYDSLYFIAVFKTLLLRLISGQHHLYESQAQLEEAH